jgi:hypothetical protein
MALSGIQIYKLLPGLRYETGRQASRTLRLSLCQRRV